MVILRLSSLINMMVLTSQDNRKIREAYNKELAKEGLGKKIENMMKDPKFISSL